MMVYAVFVEGVYRHECAGVFATLEMAKAVADATKASEPDNYHNIRVYPFELGAQAKRSRIDALLREPEHVYEAADEPSKERRQLPWDEPYSGTQVLAGDKWYE